jgi:hypothetical protein
MKTYILSELNDKVLDCIGDALINLNFGNKLVTISCDIESIVFPMGIDAEETALYNPPSAYQQMFEMKQKEEAEEAALEAERKAIREKKAVRLFLEWFGIMPDSVENGVIKSGPLQFVICDDGSRLSLKGHCPKCGEECETFTYSRLQDISEYVDPAKFLPRNHYCKTPKKSEKSLEEQLTDVLQEFIEEYSYHGE